MATGTATTKDINNIKTQIKQLIATQSSQQETLVHIISILDITRYAAQVNRHSTNILMDAAKATSHDIIISTLNHVISYQHQFSPVNTPHQVSVC